MKAVYVRYVQLLFTLGVLGVLTHGLSTVERFSSPVNDSSSFANSDDVAWEEVIIPPPLSKQQSGTQEVSDGDLVGSNVAERIRFGESILMLQNLVDSETCQELVRLVQESHSKIVGSDDKPGLMRVPTIAASKRAMRNKTPCADPMCSKADDICQAILLRALSTIDRDQPTIPKVLFPSLSVSMTDAFQSDGKKDEVDATTNYQWSSREPAVNVYTPGGEFLAHTDSQSLTILVALTEPLPDGGTAFWSQDSRGHRVEGPSLILRPPIGTALLFGGCVTHAGMPIMDGLRSVLVGSFS